MNAITRVWRAATVGLVLAGMAGGALAADFTLNINSVLTTDDPLHKGLESMKAAVEARSQGRLRVRLFPNSQLGRDEDVLEQARAGAGNAVVVDGGRLAAFTKAFGVLGAPYLASGYGDIRKIVTSPLFDGWAADLRAGAKLEVLSFNWWQGERHLLTNTPVRTPADLAGVRLRTPGAAVWTETVRAMGAVPAPMAWGDVHAALQTQAIDAAEAQYPAAYGARLQEVTKYLTKTGHFTLVTGLVTSAVWFDKLPADLQAILKEEALAAGDSASRATEASLADYEAKMRAGGMTIAEIDKGPFIAATAGVYDKLGYRDLKSQIDAIVAK